MPDEQWELPLLLKYYRRRRWSSQRVAGKAIGCGVEFMWRDIEIAGRPKPSVTLSGKVAELAERFGAGDIDLSMTHSKGMAAAVAIVQPRR